MFEKKINPTETYSVGLSFMRDVLIMRDEQGLL